MFGHRRPALLAALLMLLLAPLTVCADEGVWIDVRTADEYASGHVPQAINIPYNEIGQRIAEVTTDREEPIYLYCHSGRRAGKAKDTLVAAGYIHVVNVGGLEQAEELAAQSAHPQP
jgi:phage shock protein E